jgi:hypothetical protein
VRGGASTALADARGRTPAAWAAAKGFAVLAGALTGDAAAARRGAGGGSPLPPLPSSPFCSFAELSPALPAPGVALRVEGWMAKQGHFLRNWKNRWFVLEGRRISYFTREGARRPQGTIALARGSDVIVEERYAKPFCFTIVTLTKKFILQVRRAKARAAPTRRQRPRHFRRPHPRRRRTRRRWPSGSRRFKTTSRSARTRRGLTFPMTLTSRRTMTSRERIVK